MKIIPKRLFTFQLYKIKSCFTGIILLLMPFLGNTQANSNQEEKTKTPLSQQISINNVQLFFEEVDWQQYHKATTIIGDAPKQIILPYHQNHLTFTYSPSTTINEPHSELRYHFQLENFDSKWQKNHTTNHITYSNLPAGTYHFKVKYSFTNQQWESNTASFTFTIEAPFWQTWWFYLLLTLTLITVIYQYHVYHQKRLQQTLQQITQSEDLKKRTQEKIRKEFARDFHDEMGNHLASISLLLHILDTQITEKPVAIKDILDKLKKTSNTLLHGTKDFVWSIDPKSDTIQEVFAHLQAFGHSTFPNEEGIAFHATPPDSFINSIPLPVGWGRHIARILKEAILHRSQSDDIAYLYLNFEQKEKNVYISLMDDSNCSDNYNYTDSMKKRVKKINGTLEFTPITPKGNKMTLSFLTESTPDKMQKEKVVRFQ